jgi:hypothetical protein
VFYRHHNPASRQEKLTHSHYILWECLQAAQSRWISPCSASLFLVLVHASPFTFSFPLATIKNREIEILIVVLDRFSH